MCSVQPQQLRCYPNRSCCEHFIHKHRCYAKQKHKHRAHVAASQQEAALVNLDGIADSFDAELYAYAAVSKSYGTRGLFSSTAVQSSAVVSVPEESCLMVPWVSTTPRYRGSMQQMYSQHMPHPLPQLLLGSETKLRDVQQLSAIQLAAWLLWLARKGGSMHEHSPTVSHAWQQYIAQVMPGLHDVHCLLTLSPVDIACLPTQELQDEARRQRQWAVSVHDTLLGPSGALGLASSLDESLWALAMVRSRSFSMHLPGLSSHPITLLAPLVDLVNHAPNSSMQQYARPEWAAPFANTRQLLLTSSSAHGELTKTPTELPTANCMVKFATSSARVLLQLQPTRPIAAGDELLIDYGARDAVDSLADYGFVM